LPLLRASASCALFLVVRCMRSNDDANLYGGRFSKAGSRIDRWPPSDFISVPLRCPWQGCAAASRGWAAASFRQRDPASTGRLTWYRQPCTDRCPAQKFDPTERPALRTPGRLTDLRLRDTSRSRSLRANYRDGPGIGRGDDLLSQFVRLGAQERGSPSRQSSDQCPHHSIGVEGRKRIAGFYLADGRGNCHQPRGDALIFFVRLTNTTRSAVKECGSIPSHY
jgi:hypothetical protein